jgi:hypothetical protein
MSVCRRLSMKMIWGKMEKQKHLAGFELGCRLIMK